MSLACSGRRAADTELTLGGPLQRLVLARMAAAGDVVVTADQIVTDIWGDRAGGMSVGTLHTYVSRLRKLLGNTAIPRRGGGYTLDRSVVVVDADCFFTEVTAGGHALARADDTRAIELLRKALNRWRGRSAYGDLGNVPCLTSEVARLDETRMTATEMLSTLSSDGG